MIKQKKMYLKRNYFISMSLAVLIAASGIKAQSDGIESINEQFGDLFLKKLKEFYRAKQSCTWGHFYSVELQNCGACDTYCPNNKMTLRCGQECAAYFNEKKLNETTDKLTKADEILKDKVMTHELDIEDLRHKFVNLQNSTEAIIVEVAKMKTERQGQQQIIQDQQHKIEGMKTDLEKAAAIAQTYMDENKRMKVDLKEFQKADKNLHAENARLSEDVAQLSKTVNASIVISVLTFVTGLIFLLMWCLVWKNRHIHTAPEHDPDNEDYNKQKNPVGDVDNEVRVPLMLAGQRQVIPNGNQAPNAPLPPIPIIPHVDNQHAFGEVQVGYVNEQP